MTRILAVLLTIVPIATLAQVGAPGGTPQPSVLVTTQIPRQGSLPRTLTAYGTVQASPNGGSETLSLLRGGQVLRIMAVTGQAVRKGQPLLAVSADPAALAAYRQAVAALTLARGERPGGADAVPAPRHTRPGRAGGQGDRGRPGDA